MSAEGFSILVLFCCILLYVVLKSLLPRSIQDIHSLTWHPLTRRILYHVLIALLSVFSLIVLLPLFIAAPPTQKTALIAAGVFLLMTASGIFYAQSRRP